MPSSNLSQFVVAKIERHTPKKRGEFCRGLPIGPMRKDPCESSLGQVFGAVTTAGHAEAKVLKWLLPARHYRGKRVRVSLEFNSPHELLICRGE